MDYTFPDYYKGFQCVADKCPDTCCAGWQIVIDKKALREYKNYPGGFGNRLYNSIDWKEGVFKQYSRRCAFLNEKNLCDIYSEAGREMLCRTCRRYPRHYEEFENIREISLSLSCPEVAKMLLNREEKVTFQTMSRKGKEEVYEDFDFLLFSKLADVRELIIEVMQNRQWSASLRMACVLVIAYRMQDKIDNRQIFQIDEQLDKFKDVFNQEDFRSKEAVVWFETYKNQKNRFQVMRKLFSVLYELETLNPKWTGFLKKCENFLYGQGQTFYNEIYVRWCQDHKQREIQLEQLMVYFIFTYFCGSVYDGHPLSKVKEAVFHTLMIQELEMAVYGMEEQLEETRQIEIAYRYAREIEHSDLNLNQVELLTRRREWFKMANLLSIIW